ncbi:nuclear transport factor 2 family protein [Actinomadura sp. NAK00032]|uniref:ester cyclase n=1 Tax=Actinomadura sp. NAK00032 TaxID=2742128 RepID=UPI00158FE2C0|nr:nuclear transport factor 2 family protein [Actinomadura sp. NAK00032]QKW36612.1 nuclear transport factor 2 family protein [Actinomadura sp. NAK00032]
MISREHATALVRRMQECFNTRRFDQAAELHAPDFVSHPLGSTGFAAGRAAWRTLTGRFPAIRVVAEDILVDGDRAAVRSSVEGIPGGARPVLFEIFRFEDGRFAEMWGAGAGFPAAASPEDVAGRP